MKHFRRHLSTALAGLCTLSIGPSLASANGQNGVCEAQYVPIVLVAPPDAAGYVLPTCSKCRHMMLETQTTVTGGTQGVLELTYHDDDDGEFVGTIELTVVLVDDTEHALVIENVWLTEGEDAAWVLDAPNAWSWDQAEMVRLAFVTTA